MSTRVKLYAPGNKKAIIADATRLTKVVELLISILKGGPTVNLCLPHREDM